MELTLSVSSFHVPATPGTTACAPSRPSMPTVRATLVTCSAKMPSVFVMLLSVSARAAISPLASSTRRWRRSPLATEVTTFTMPRTWVVRLDAIWLTLSVRSFHTPDTPGTSAWPPSLPSVPTSLATRVTSDENAASWSTIVLTVLPMRRNSPLTGRPSISSAILRVRSPWATASMTRATSMVGCTRSLMSALTETTAVRQSPSMSPRDARSSMRPSRPTTRSTRMSSRVRSSMRETAPLKARARSSTTTEVPCTGRRTPKSPSSHARSASSSGASAAVVTPALALPLSGGSSTGERLLRVRLREGDPLPLENRSLFITSSARPVCILNPLTETTRCIHGRFRALWCRERRPAPNLIAAP